MTILGKIGESKSSLLFWKTFGLKKQEQVEILHDVMDEKIRLDDHVTAYKHDKNSHQVSIYLL